MKHILYTPLYAKSKKNNFAYRLVIHKIESTVLRRLESADTNFDRK